MTVTRKINRVKAHIEDFIWQKSLRSRMVLILSFASRRGIPLPLAYLELTKPKVDELSTNDLGDEGFLASFMIPQQGKCLVDIGASIGGWTLFAAEKGVEVYAFEPSPNAFKVLAKRVAGYNVHLYPYALGSVDTVETMGFSQYDFGVLMNENHDRRLGAKLVDVVVHSLDSMNLQNVGVIKIDTEGYEIPILKGAKKTIHSNKPLLIIEVHKGTGEALNSFEAELGRIKGLLKEYGYYVWQTHYRPISLKQMQPHIIAKPLPEKQQL